MNSAVINNETEVFTAIRIQSEYLWANERVRILNIDEFRISSSLGNVDKFY